jgi:hypothetical protein
MLSLGIAYLMEWKLDIGSKHFLNSLRAFTYLISVYPQDSMLMSAHRDSDPPSLIATHNFRLAIGS